MEKKKSLAILGSTGTLGKQTLDVIAAYPDRFEVEVLTAHSNADLLVEQALKFRPNAVVIAQKDLFRKVSDVLFDNDIKVFAGVNSVAQVTEMENIDLVVNALAGFAGIQPSLTALKAKKPLALANRESMVIAGELVIRASNEYHVPILPIGISASSLFQCLAGETHNSIEKVLLTTSGKPFHGMNREQLEKVMPEQLLSASETAGVQYRIDAATLIGTGWEMAEAKWLLNLQTEQIDVVVQPEEVVHSILQFGDGSMKAQLGLNDPKVPLLYAMNYPYRIDYGTERISFLDLPALHFERPDTLNFPCLQLAIDAIKGGGNLPCALHAANEQATKAFLEGAITFTEITNINHKCLHAIDHLTKASLADLQATHAEAAELANFIINKIVS